MTADVLDALVVFLRADAGVIAAAEGKTIDGVADTPAVFYGELPASFVAQMPFACVTLTRSGRVPGPGDNSYLRVQRPRIDVRSYGASKFEANAVYEAAHEALKQLTPQVVALDAGDVRLHNTVVSGGPIDLVDPETKWPFVWSSYGVGAAEVAVA